MMQLPEIVLRILEHIYYIPKGNVDYASLCVCSLVCRTWRAAAQLLLVRRVFLHRTLSISPQAFRSLRTQASSIRVLDVTVGDRPQDAISPLIFAMLFVRCSQLYELCIDARGVHSFDEDVMQILSASPPFIALQIKGTDVKSVLPYQLLSLTDSVRHLSLHSEWHSVPPSKPIKHKLYELVIRTAPHGDLLLWLVSASAGTLQLLEMWDIRDLWTMRIILSTLGANIRSLRVLYYGFWIPQLLPCCTNLDELVLFTLPYSTYLNFLPRSITHLAFSNPEQASESSPSFDWVLKAIETLPNLRLVTCEKSSTEHIDFPRLEALCDHRKIKLNCRYYLFCALEDMIPGRRYPRHRTISNFDLMI